MPSLIVRLTRLSETRHRFEALRPDGSRDVRELETKSFLRHDLVHFALESEASLTHSFYGLLARGGEHDKLGEPLAGEALDTERVVGALQGVSKDRLDPDRFAYTVRSYFRNVGEEPPVWLTADLIARAAARLRQLEGQWRALPFGETMTLEFPL